MQSLPEGDFAFVLYKSEAARFHIEEGNDLPAKTYEMIEEEILLKRARDRALYLLQSQGRTQAELMEVRLSVFTINRQLIMPAKFLCRLPQCGQITVQRGLST